MAGLSDTVSRINALPASLTKGGYMTDAEKIAEIKEVLKAYNHYQGSDASTATKVEDAFATISLIDDAIEGKTP